MKKMLAGSPERYLSPDFICIDLSARRVFCASAAGNELSAPDGFEWENWSNN